MTNFNPSNPARYPATSRRSVVYDDFPEYCPGKPRLNAKLFSDVWTWSILGADDGGLYCVSRYNPQIRGHFQPSAILDVIEETDGDEWLDLEDYIDAVSHLLRITPPMRWHSETCLRTAYGMDEFDDDDDDPGTDEM